MLTRNSDDDPEAARAACDDGALLELHRLFDGREARLLGDVLGCGSQRLDDMRAGLDQRDGETLAWAADALRGAADLVGARGLSLLCSRLALSSREGGWDDARALVDAIGVEYARVRRRLEGELMRPRPV